MLKEAIALEGGESVILMDSISYVDDSDVNHVVVTGSHGGTSSGEYAMRLRMAGVVFNDAGVGRENAGIESLTLLQSIGVPAAAVSHETGKIGQAKDMWDHGIISHVNAEASKRGVVAGQTTKEAVLKLLPDSHGSDS